MLPTADRRELYVAAILGNDRDSLLGRRLPIGEGVAGWVASTGEPVNLHGEIQDPRFTPVRSRPEIRAAVSVPMLAGG